MMKTKRMEFRVTPSEFLIIKRKANQSGSTVSDYVRNTAMNYQLSHKLTSDELDTYKMLIKYADNFRRIDNYLKKGDITGMKEETKKTAIVIRQHLNKLK